MDWSSRRHRVGKMRLAVWVMAAMAAVVAVALLLVSQPSKPKSSSAASRTVAEPPSLDSVFTGRLVVMWGDGRGYLP